MSNLDRVFILREFIESEPDNPFNHYALALEIKDIDTSGATSLFDFLLENYPDYLPTYFIAAQFFHDLGQIPKAQTIYLNGIKLAEIQGDKKAQKELQAAYQNFLFETDLD